MDVSFSQAAKAYGKVVNPEGSGALTPSKSGQDAFANMLSDASEKAIENLSAGEKVTMQAVAGEAELADVVTAVTQAEITLQTVMSIRDTLVDSYNRLMQMPI